MFNGGGNYNYNNGNAFGTNTGGFGFGGGQIKRPGIKLKHKNKVKKIAEIPAKLSELDEIIKKKYEQFKEGRSTYRMCYMDEENEQIDISDDEDYEVFFDYVKQQSFGIKKLFLKSRSEDKKFDPDIDDCQTVNESVVLNGPLTGGLFPNNNNNLLGANPFGSNSFGTNLGLAKSRLDELGRDDGGSKNMLEKILKKLKKLEKDQESTKKKPKKVEKKKVKKEKKPTKKEKLKKKVEQKNVEEKKGEDKKAEIVNMFDEPEARLSLDDDESGSEDSDKRSRSVHTPVRRNSVKRSRQMKESGSIPKSYSRSISRKRQESSHHSSTLKTQSKKNESRHSSTVKGNSQLNKKSNHSSTIYSHSTDKMDAPKKNLSRKATPKRIPPRRASVKGEPERNIRSIDSGSSVHSCKHSKGSVCSIEEVKVPKKADKKEAPIIENSPRSVDQKLEDDLICKECLCNLSDKVKYFCTF
jgi:hypothetical protein